VRGRLTAQALGLPHRLAIGDAALLVREVIDPAPAPVFPVSFMPHHLTVPYDSWQDVCESLSIRFIDPTASVEATLEAIRTSALLITESLHGAVVADALRVPWIAVRSRPRILGLKWQDWASAVGVEHRFEWLPPVWSDAIDSRAKRLLHPPAERLARSRLRWLVRFGKRRLSTEASFRGVYGRMIDAFHRMIDEV
jgi:succinoglycan biosynthesis protein ExoV